jgi:hypothetical protein
MTPEALAQAALSAAPLTAALRLADWIGGGRELTSTGVLRPALAVEACQLLGIDLPSGKLRSAKDVPALQQAWDVALAGGLVLVARARARAASDVPDLLRAAEGTAPLPAELADRAALAWIRGAGVPMGFPFDEPCTQCLTVLHELSLATKPTETGALVDAVREDNPVADAFATAMDADTEDDEDATDLNYRAALDYGLVPGGLSQLAELMADDVTAHTHATISFLTQFDAAFTGPGRTPGGTVTLTPLGKLLAGAVFDALTPPADASAAELVPATAGLPRAIVATVASPWIDARTPEEAVRELLAYAEQAEPGLRVHAIELAKGHSDRANAAWREVAARPGFGAYARNWLAELGEDVPPDSRDEAWLLADSISQAGAGVPPELASFVFAAAVRQCAGNDMDALLDDLRKSGHPLGPELADLVAGGTLPSDTAGILNGSGPGLSGAGFSGLDFGDDFDDDLDDLENELPKGSLLRLKITLRGVSKPPVWRRVLVPADMTLDELHEVILHAMGWSGGHLHSFRSGLGEFGPADDDFGLDLEDETEVELGALLAEPGDRLKYTYDFGDDWEHDIRVEEVIPPDAAGAAPVCLAGKGACPPEDCGGTYGYAELKAALADPEHEEHDSLLGWLGLASASQFDATAFSPDESNARLRTVRKGRQ